MTLNAVQIGEVLEEIRPVLEGCRFGSVFQPSRDVAVIVLEQGETRRKLLISMEWWGSRLHLVSRRLPRIKTPQPFFGVLSRSLHGAVLREVTQVNGDRIVEMRFVSGQDGSEQTARMIVELMGPVSNACLLDGAGKIKTMHRKNFAGRREFKPGDFYVPPPMPPARPSATEGLPLDEFKDRPHPLSEAVDAKYETLARERTQEEDRRRVTDRLHGTCKKWQRRVEAMEKEHQESIAYEREYQLGEILKANLDKISPRMQEITLDDIYGEGQVTIRLDETLSPVENMERQFKRARKLKAALPVIERRLARARRELAAVEAALEKAREGELCEEDVPAFLRPRPPRRPVKPKEKKQKRRMPCMQFTSKDGLSILVGRNNAENDKLTMQVARGNDIWMHVQHQTGSHVVVQMPRGKTLSLDALLDAANLAVYYSKVREARKVPVDYTYKKFVRKMKKADPGKVTYSNNKTIIIAPDRERLKRLLGKDA
jgi:predicted ribosome quality control (RQC) complex YloA/Tae2 family protein